MTAAVRTPRAAGLRSCADGTQRRTDRVCPAEKTIIIAAAVAETMFPFLSLLSAGAKIKVVFSRVQSRAPCRTAPGYRSDRSAARRRGDFPARSCCRPCRTARRPSAGRSAFFEHRTRVSISSAVRLHSRKCSLCLLIELTCKNVLCNTGDQSCFFPQRTGLPVPQR